MVNEKKLARINELARKSKSSGLSDEEKTEQAALRKEYLAAFRMNFVSMLESVEVVGSDEQDDSGNNILQ